jgi:[protein-PII] uridylyltransferase
MPALTPATCRERIRDIRDKVFDPATLPLIAAEIFSRAIDALLVEIYHKFIDVPETDQHICLIALGGYGREEMFPFSDVDILILHEYDIIPEKIGAAVRFFWDTGLTMGCAVRTFVECRAILEEDIATDTAFLESRFIAGNHTLCQNLINAAVMPYFRKRKSAFIAEMQASIRDGLFSSQDSIYKIEPAIKTGVCGLRDCQRVVWAERVHYDCRPYSEARQHSPFLVLNGTTLDNCYQFLAKVRTALHRSSNRRVDILETASQPAVALFCGFGDNGAGLLMEEYFKTVRTIRTILASYLETTTPRKRLLRKFNLAISGNRPMPGIALYNGILFAIESTPNSTMTPLWIITVFQNALVCRATLSTGLCECISIVGKSFTDDDFKSQAISSIIRAMLTFDGPVGRVFSQMHDTGILSRIIPPFSELLCKVEYDSYHEYTVDQHILLTITACDELNADHDDSIRAIFRNVPRKMLLRLALLLHDVGKALPGDHSVNSAVIAETICERLGLNEEETERVCLLVHRHLELHNQSLLREPQEELLQRFAVQVVDRENLDMLYLLTIVDIRCVSRKAWTGWKAFQLQQQYERTLAILTTPDAAPAQSQTAHSYENDTLPEEREMHTRWLAELRSGTSIILHNEEYRGFERITICGHDRLGFFTDIVGCLTSEGYNILSAKVYTLAGGLVLDIFSLEPPELPAIPPQKRIENINRKWADLTNGAANAQDLINERMRKYPLEHLRGLVGRPVVVRADNETSPDYTILEVDTADNFGLLHRIAQCLSANSINIVLARLTTRIDRAVDVFYVTEKQGDRIKDPIRLQKITQELERILAL